MCLDINFTFILSLSHDCLLIHALIQSLARLLHALCYSLAFSPASQTHSVAYLLPAFLAPSLPTPPLPLFSYSLVCLLSPSFLPFDSSLDFNLSLSFPHSLTHTFSLLHFLTNYLARSLSLLSHLICPLAFKFTLPLTYSLPLTTRTLDCVLLHSLDHFLAGMLFNALTHSLTLVSSFLLSFIHALVRSLALFLTLSPSSLFSHLACFFSPLLLPSLVPSLCCLAFLSLARFLPSSLFHSLTHSKRAHSLTYLLIRSHSCFMLTHLLVLSRASSFTELHFAHSLAFFSPYPLTSLIVCFLPPPILTPVHLLAASLPSSLVTAFTRSSTCLFSASIPH